MEFEAKKLRKKLTLMIPNAVNNARIRTTWKEENCEENGQNKLKLPVIKKNQAQRHVPQRWLNESQVLPGTT